MSQKSSFSRKLIFLKNDHVLNLGKCSFWPEKSPCGVVPQQNKGCKHIPDHSRPNSDQIIYKNLYIYSNFIENRGFSIKITKQIEIVAKALLRQHDGRACSDQRLDSPGRARLPYDAASSAACEGACHTYVQPWLHSKKRLPCLEKVILDGRANRGLI